MQEISLQSVVDKLGLKIAQLQIDLAVREATIDRLNQLLSGTPRPEDVT